MDYCENGLLKIFMSDIVRLELRRQFEKEINAKNIEINKINKDAIRLGLAEDIKEISIEIQLKKFDRYYKSLALTENFILLPYKNEFLPDIVERAINRKKPFTEEKTELKDAIIWKTYADYVESNDIHDCILLTNNTNDFGSKSKLEIHHDLQKDTKKFTLINSSFAFIKAKASILESPEHQFQSFISQINIDNNFAFIVIKNTFEKQISEAVLTRTNTLHPNDILKHYIIDGQIIAHEVEIMECEDVEFELLSSSALISGNLFVNCETEVLEYNPSRDFGEESYNAIADRLITYVIGFNFDLSIDNKYSNFEITDLDIYTID